MVTFILSPLINSLARLTAFAVERVGFEIVCGKMLRRLILAKTPEFLSTFMASFLTSQSARYNHALVIIMQFF